VVVNVCTPAADVLAGTAILLSNLPVAQLVAQARDVQEIYQSGIERYLRGITEVSQRDIREVCIQDGKGVCMGDVYWMMGHA
jgi:hypothetical protein